MIQPPSQEQRCQKHIEGPKVSRRVVAWRRQCRRRRMKGFQFCHDHLLFADWQKWRDQKAAEVWGK